MLISFDNGMGNGKLYFIHKGKEYEIHFNSRYKELGEENTDTLVINNKIYSFNEGRSAVQLGHMTKNNDIHRLLLYKAMYEAYKITGDSEFDIVTNCSLDSYKIDQGKSIQEFQTETKLISIKDSSKNESIDLIINKLIVLPECLCGCLMSNLKIKEEDVIAIDIGSKNFQLLQIQYGNVLYDTSYATRYGMNNILIGSSDIIKTFEPKLKSTNAIQTYLYKTNTKTFPIREDVDTAISNFLNNNIFPEIEERLNEMDTNIFTKYIFLGGGSKALRRFIEKQYQNKTIYFIDNPYFANAKGQYKKAAKILGYNQKIKKGDI